MVRDPADEEAKRKAWVARQVANRPPWTPERIARLADILNESWAGLPQVQSPANSEDADDGPNDVGVSDSSPE